MSSGKSPSNADATLRCVEDLPEENTATNNTNGSVSDITLTQTVLRKTKSNVKSKRQQQFIVTMAAGECMTDIFPEWLLFALYGPPGQRRYRPYDLNMPLAIPRRHESRYKLDPPLTEHGKVTASMTAMGIIRNNLRFKVIYCAPEMAAVQTANTVSLTSKHKKIPIRIEPALANWRGFLNGNQSWESKEFYSKLGYDIDVDYQPFMKEIRPDETPKDFLQRKINFYAKIAGENAHSCLMIIGHAATLYMAADGTWETKNHLLDIERHRRPCGVYGLHLGIDGEHTALSRPTLPLTASLNEARQKRLKAAEESEKSKKIVIKTIGSSQSDSSENDTD